MPFISSFDIISIVLLCEVEDEGWWSEAEKEEWRPNPKIFLCIPASAADAAAVNPKRIKTHLANGLITFFFNGNPVLVMDQEVYQETLLIVLC